MMLRETPCSCCRWCWPSWKSGTPRSCISCRSAMMRTKPAAIDRRAFLGLGSGVVAACLAGSAADAEEPGLGARAAERGLIFGAAVQGQALRKNLAYRDAVIRECGVIVPEWEMKWGEIERTRGRLDYGHADWLANFAAQ